MMLECVRLFLASIGGVLLGLIFFGGLWWTVRHRLNSSHAAWWFLGSLFIRLATVLVGIYFIGQHDWRQMLACLLGFAAGKLIVVLRVREKGGAKCA